MGSNAAMLEVQTVTPDASAVAVPAGQARPSRMSFALTALMLALIGVPQQHVTQLGSV